MKDKQQTGYGKYGNKNWRMLWRAVTVVYTMYTMKMMRNIIREISAGGTTVLLVEQNAKKALAIADRAYVLETGNIVLSGDAKEMMNNDSIKKAYLGE